MSCKYPAIQVKLAADHRHHISETIHDALEFSKDMNVKVVVETVRGYLFIAPTDIREEILVQWTDLCKAG